jgi:ACT domain-containing protein
MALTVKRITLWRREIENRPGALASTLEPLAEAGADLRLVMGYRYPETTSRAAIEVFPVTGKKAVEAALGRRARGLPARVPARRGRQPARPRRRHWPCPR